MQEPFLKAIMMNVLRIICS